VVAYSSAPAQEVRVEIGRLLLGPGEVQDPVQLHNQAMIWVVKASLATQGSSGLLQQLLRGRQVATITPSTAPHRRNKQRNRGTDLPTGAQRGGQAIRHGCHDRPRCLETAL